MYFIFLNLLNSLKICIFDAGSTGTRLHIYDFTDNISNNEIPINIPSSEIFINEIPINIPSSEIFINEIPIPMDIPGNKFKSKIFHINGGLHELSLEKINKNILKLIKNAKNEINKTIPMGFYGTAGLRNSKNKNKILKQVKMSLKEYNLIDIKILEGNDEAIGLFSAFEFLFPKISNYFLLDMGGMSTQLIKKNKSKIIVESINTGIINQSNIDNAVEANRSDDDDERDNESDDDERDNESDDDERDNRSNDDEEANISDDEEANSSDAKNISSPSANKSDAENGNSSSANRSKNTNIFLFSSFENILKNFKNNFTILDLENKKNEICKNENKKCENEKNEICKNISFILKFLKYSKIKSTEKMKIIKNSKNFYISWPLGKAIELLNKMTKRYKNV